MYQMGPLDSKLQSICQIKDPIIRQISSLNINIHKIYLKKNELQFKMLIMEDCVLSINVKH